MAWQLRNLLSEQDSRSRFECVAVLILLILCVIGYGAWAYNTLVRFENLREEAWSGIDVQLKRRHNLIPNLVEIVKGYASHEESTLQNVVRLRAESEGATRIADKGIAEKKLGGDLKQLFALAEAYPDLKADASFLELQENLVEIEDQIQFARRYYNGTVRNLNIKVQSFPSNVFANLFSFSSAEFFEVEYATERQAPEVDF